MAKDKLQEQVYLVWLPPDTEVTKKPAFILKPTLDSAIKTYIKYHSMLSRKKPKILKITANAENSYSHLGAGNTADTIEIPSKSIWKRAYEMSIEKEQKKRGKNGK